jgi:hypothetical protein
MSSWLWWVLDGINPVVNHTHNDPSSLLCCASLPLLISPSSLSSLPCVQSWWHYLVAATYQPLRLDNQPIGFTLEVNRSVLHSLFPSPSSLRVNDVGVVISD